MTVAVTVTVTVAVTVAVTVGSLRSRVFFYFSAALLDELQRISCQHLF